MDDIVQGDTWLPPDDSGGGIRLWLGGESGPAHTPLLSRRATVGFDESARTPSSDSPWTPAGSMATSTPSTITCGPASASTGPNGDGSLTREDLAPGTYACTVIIDP